MESHRKDIRCPRCKGPKEGPFINAGYCRACMAEWQKNKRTKNREQGLCACGRIPREGRGSCEKCNRVRHTSPKAAENTRRYRIRHADRLAQQSKERAHKLKRDVLAAYGGEHCVCVDCTVTEFEFLSIDHIDGGGHQHRKLIRDNIYRWLKKKGYPSGFRVLCMNCNFSRGRYGYCPHEKVVLPA